MHNFRGPMFRVPVLLHVWSTHASEEIREKKDVLVCDDVNKNIIF